MAILPIQLARVSNTLRSNLAQRTLTQTQQSLIEVQNQIATGKKLNVPSDDPGAAATAMQLRKTLEQRQGYSDNIKFASSNLSEVDSTLSNLTDLLRNAESIASANVGSDVTADQRTAASAVVDSLYQQAITLGNQQFQGVYLFAGDSGASAPFASNLGGVQFNGSDRVLTNSFDESSVLPFMANGNDVFGAMSNPVAGADLSPNMTLQTRLADLRGAGGEGIAKGSIQISDGTNSAVVDLSKADTVGDVVNAINAAHVGTITAGIGADGKSIQLASGGADNITVADTPGGSTAADLGILQTVGAGPGASLNGKSVSPTLTSLTRLADLRDGAGIDLSHGLVISNGGKSATVDLSGLDPAKATVQDLMTAINKAGAGALARINSDGNGIEVLNTVQGTSMSIAENGGSTATDLGIRTFSATSTLSGLNSGKGVGLAAGKPDLQITRRDGSAFTVNLDGCTTIQGVIGAINAADGGGGVSASFATSGNGIILTDTTGGAGSLQAASLNSSTAAEDLGIAGSVAGPTLTGKDANALEAPGVFANLAKLNDALKGNDPKAITAAAQAIQADLDRVTRIRGQVGAQVQALDSRQQRIDDQNVATQSLLSSIEDTDYNEAVTRYQTLQTALQANLQTTGKLLNMSLLEFLG